MQKKLIVYRINKHVKVFVTVLSGIVQIASSS